MQPRGCVKRGKKALPEKKLRIQTGSRSRRDMLLQTRQIRTFSRSRFRAPCACYAAQHPSCSAAGTANVHSSIRSISALHLLQFLLAFGSLFQAHRCTSPSLMSTGGLYFAASCMLLFGFFRLLSGGISGAARAEYRSLVWSSRCTRLPFECSNREPTDCIKGQM